MTQRLLSALLPVVLLSTSLAGAQNAALLARPTARITARIDRATRATLPGTHPAVVARATIGGRLAANTQLEHMVLVLNASDEQNAALQTLMDQQQDKTSPNYHKWLTPDTYATSFGVASSDIAQVSAWLADSKLPVESVSRSGRFITFSGSVAAVEAAFSTEMHNVTLNGEAHISNTTDISVPAALSSVVRGVARLNNFRPKSSAKDWQKVSLAKNAPNSVELNQPQYGTNPSGTHYIGAGDLANIYNAKPLTSAGIDGKGVTIAVLARSNITLPDVQAYRSFFGLPKNDPNIIVVGTDPGENSDDIEAFLDAELAGALAPAATIDFIVSGVSLVGGDIDAAALYSVDNNIGDIISLSYGGCEASNGLSGSTFWNILWEEAAAQGQTAFISSGDSGAAGCDSSSATFATKGYGVNALGSSNFNVAVGGSMFVDFGPAQYWATTPATIPYATAIGYIPEAALNQSRLTTTELNSASTAFVTGSGIFAGGGGISIYNPRPSWQTGSGISPTSDPAAVSGTGIAAGSTITGPHRLVPDVAFISANGHDGTLFCAEGVCQESASGGLANAGIVGGTSVATPAIAGAQALINAANGGRQGNANYFYYPLANQQYTASTTACQSVNGTPANPTVPLPAATCNFQDIVTGSITVPSAATGTAGIGFNAGVGFDAATGLGSVNIANLANNWKNVNFNSTTTTLSLTPTTTTHGTQQIAAIQVAAGTGTPTGDVSIIASSYPATGTPQVFRLTSGAVNGIVDSLPGGTYSVHAHYAGDGTFGASDSAPVSVTISKEGSSIFFQPYLITAAGSVNPLSSFTYGSGEIYLDTEITPASSNGTASGSVTYIVKKDGASLPSLTNNLDTHGTTYLTAGPNFANFYLNSNYPTLSPGSYIVTANYSGDASLNPVTSTTSFTVNQATPTVSYTTSTASITSGSNAILNFTITTPAAATPATGTVTFTDTTTSTTLGTANVVNGKATFTTTGITASGANSITAVYSGDVNYAAATPAAVTVTVTAAAATTTVLTSTAGPSVGTSVTLTATVTPIPTTASTVSFYDAGVLLGTSAVSTSTGRATLAVTTFNAASHALTAVYAGNSAQLTSTGSLTLTVAKATTTMAIGGGQTSTYGQTIYLNGSITRSPAPTTVAVPLTGVVNFYEGSTAGTLLGSATPVLGQPGGYNLYAAVLAISTLTAGNHTIVASYPGDANYSGSTSIAAPVTVSKASQTISFSGLPATAAYPAGPYTLNATASSGLPITYTVTGPAYISGNMLFITGAGTVTVTASQAGDANNNAAPSVTLTIIVTGGTPQLATTAIVSKGSGGSYLVTYTVKNTGTGTASNVQITAATLGSASASGLPANLGNIASGASFTTTLAFPASAGASGSAAVERVTGTYTGGTFGGSLRVALP